MADPFVAEIRIFPLDFPPDGWAACDGQLLPVAQNPALFTILGPAYGGDGVDTFALPDLRGRAPMHPGQGPGLSPRSRGEAGGSETAPLGEAQLPPHTHTLRGSNTAGDSITPGGNTLARFTGMYRQPAAQGLADMAPEALAGTGGGGAHENMMPYLTVGFCIALQGVFPPRP